MIASQASDDFWYARPRTTDFEQFTEAEWAAAWHDNWHVWCGCPL